MYDKSMFILRYIYPFLVLFLVIFVVASFIVDSVQLKNNPVQSEQVEVISKRIVESRSGTRGYRTTYYFVVAFKFPDDSIKEFWVCAATDREYRKANTYYSVYEGDTGTLTYKENKIFEIAPFSGRKFISFEKDLEYGGIKIERGNLSETPCPHAHTPFSSYNKIRGRNSKPPKMTA